MRRDDTEIRNSEEIEAIIRRAKVCRLGLCCGTYPHVVPVCFGYEPGVLWVHSAKEGKKIDLIAANPRISFEFDEVFGAIPADSSCAWGMRYMSVIGSGVAEIVRDPEEKMRVLSCIMEQYSDRNTGDIPAGLGEVCVIRIRIAEMTGKRSPPYTRN